MIKKPKPVEPWSPTKTCHLRRNPRRENAREITGDKEMRDEKSEGCSHRVSQHIVSTSEGQWVAGITYASLRAPRKHLSGRLLRMRWGRGRPWPETVYASARASLGPSSTSGGGTWKRANLPLTVKGRPEGEKWSRKIWRKMKSRRRLKRHDML